MADEDAVDGRHGRDTQHPEQRREEHPAEKCRYVQRTQIYCISLHSLSFLPPRRPQGLLSTCGQGIHTRAVIYTLAAPHPNAPAPRYPRTLISPRLTAPTERKKSRIVRLVLPSHLIRLYFTPSDEDYKTLSYSVFGGKDRHYNLRIQIFLFPTHPYTYSSTGRNIHPKRSP